MSFWKPTKATPKIKYTGSGKAGENWMKGFIGSFGSGSSPNVPDIPEQQTADMTPMEQASMSLLDNYAQNGTEGYNLAMNNAKSTLALNNDPTRDPEYQSFLAEQNRLRDATNSRLLRSAKLGGTTDSSPAQGTINDANMAYDAQAMGVLGQTQDKIIARKTNAAGMAADLGTQQENSAITAMKAEEQARQIEQQKKYNSYVQQMTTLMFPYTTMASIAQNAANSGQYRYMQAGGPSDFATAVGIANGTMGVAGGAMSMGLLPAMKGSGPAESPNAYSGYNSVGGGSNQSAGGYGQY